MQLLRKNITVVMVLGLSILTQISVSGAIEWAVEPSLSLRGEYNDNLFFSSAPHEARGGTWVSPGAKFKATTESLEVSGSARAEFVNYYGKGGVEYVNLSFPVTVAYRTEKDVWGLGGTFNRDNTLLTELRQTGVVNSFAQRTFAAVQPSWTRSLTERLSFRASYDLTDVTYENGLSRGLFNYLSHEGKAGLSYNLSQSDLIEGTASYANFDVPDRNLQASVGGVLAKATHQFSEILSGTLGGGVRAVSTTFPSGGGVTQSDQNLIPVGSANMEMKLESTVINGGLSREVFPSGLGQLVRTDRVSISVGRELTPTLTASLTGDVYWVKPVGPPLAYANSRYYRISPKVRWRLSDWWSLDATYSYSQFEADQIGYAAFQNTTYVTLSYSGFKIETSR